MDTGSDFDEFLHAVPRLTIVALLAPAGWTEFAFIRDSLAMGDSALSKQLSALAGEGYVEVRKQFGTGARRTLVRLTPKGREAFVRHAAALQRIAATAHAMPADESDQP
ncbi:winged helix-turn-helix domain-containing protein [Streptomyces sp. NPDC001698]|uniref:winged helix-turn-helix domain-containing protein n=1 Tax=unclassified Streptomyces TaxID=2593676 RepID=UPI0036AB1B37